MSAACLSTDAQHTPIPVCVAAMEIGAMCTASTPRMLDVRSHSRQIGDSCRLSPTNSIEIIITAPTLGC